MIPFDPGEGFLPVDTDGLRATAGFLRDAGGQMRDQAGRLSSVVASVRAGGGAWEGEAANVWQEDGHQRASWYSQAGEAWYQMAGILFNVASQIDEARSRYVQANQAAFDSMQQASMYEQLANAQPGQPDPQAASRAQWAEQDAQGSIGAANQALADAVHALQTAAGQLSPFIGEAATMCPHPLTAGPHQGTLAPSGPWATLLFGSVIGNRVTGRAFQEQVLNELGVKENTTRFPVNLPGGGQYTTVPDGKSDTALIEVKSSAYVYRSTQLRAQVELAEEEGLTPTLVVQRWTKVNGSALRLFRDAGGRVMVRLGNNVYRNYNDTADNPTLYKGEGGGGFKQIEETAPTGAAPTTSAGGVPEPGTPGAETPSEPVAPEPVDPEPLPIGPDDPILPLP